MSVNLIARAMLILL